MQTAEALLEIIHERGKRGLPLERLYRHLFNPELYLRAYGKIYRNEGAMTPGATAETVDGMSLTKVQAIIEVLRQERYRWAPVRRTYIDKKNSSKKRPLGLPTWSDKLLQEVIRLLLEAYYEPQFSDRSHGFRPGRGCHTALQEIQRQWRGTVWFIEGDITDCFGALDHSIMRSILAEDIRDGRFLRLIDGLLRAGYLEDWRYHETLSGAPQGGILSPLLSNVYLNRLDRYVETTLLPVYNQGDRRRPYLPYMRLHKAVWKLEKKGQRGGVTRQMRRELQQLPSRDPNDPSYRRLHYIRYCDDWLLGYTGTRREAEDIKGKIGRFLGYRMKLDLSEHKTLITHGRTEPARFLGYEIVVHNSDTKRDRHGHRCINGQIGLKMPMDIARAKCKPYMRRDKPAAILTRAHDSDFRIVARYQAEFRGIAEYYQLAYNRHRLGRLRWIMERSLTKTLGHKSKISVNKVWSRYRATWQTPAGPRRGLQVKVERGNGKKPLVARWGGVSLAHRRITREVLKDDLPAIWRKHPAELVTRLRAGLCELCHARADVETHHVRRLHDLRTGNQAEQPEWAKLMASRRRKTLIVCRDCHDQIHNGHSPRQVSRNVALESDVR